MQIRNRHTNSARTDATLVQNAQRNKTQKQNPTKKLPHKTEQQPKELLISSPTHILATTHHIHYAAYPNNAQTGHSTQHKHTTTNQWNSNFGSHPGGINRVLRLLIGWWQFLFFKIREPMTSRDGSVNGKYVYGDPKWLSTSTERKNIFLKKNLSDLK